LLYIDCKFFSIQKGGPPKIGGPVRPNSLNMPKAGPVQFNEHSTIKQYNVTLKRASTASTQ